MANNSFRDSVNSLGWSRRDPDLPVHTGASSNTPFLSRLRSYNPFGEGGYVQLPTHNEGPGAPLPAATRREEEEGFFACKFFFFFSLLPCDHPILRSSRTPLCVVQVMRLQFLRREDYYHACLCGCKPIEERNTLTRTLRIVSRWDRMLIFAACNLGAAVCFMLCFFLFPVLTLKPRKFAVL
jgi:hypothetical protein